MMVSCWTIYFVALVNLIVSISFGSLLSTTRPQTWSNRLGINITPISTGLWAAERPFIWNGIDVGGRSVIARMNSKKNGELGGLLIHSPVEHDEDLRVALEGLGGTGVQAIVSPNYEHLKYAKQWAMAYPGAQKWACPGLPERMPEVAWTHEVSKTSEELDGFEYVWFDCETNPATGRAFFNEVVFFHKLSKAVFMADAYWNYPSTEHVNYKGQGETGKVHKCPKVPVSRDYLPDVEVPIGTRLWKFGMDNLYLPFYKKVMVGTGERLERYNACVEKVLSWKAELIVPCHGDIVKGPELVQNVLSNHFL